ncbi:MAG TPA: lysophospholipid acyltransferase family protein [Herpetosiphonaceae bacterium]
MIQQAVRLLLLRLVHLFYPRIEIQGRELVPSGRPTLFVLNHPNGLLDPLVLMIALRCRVSFLAKNTLFKVGAVRWLMRVFGALPIYRQSDAGAEGGDLSGHRAKNEQTFARCRELLRILRPLALFPEGTTHSETTLLPLRTGAARIALSAEAEAGWQLGAQVVPVGLWYQNKTLFRSAVLLVVGEPFAIDGYREEYERDPEAAVDALTAEIARRLGLVVLQAENTELLNGIPVLARWTLGDGEPESLREEHLYTSLLMQAYLKLRESDPGQLATLAGRARRYARTLRTLGIRDPWALELPSVGPWRLLSLALLLALGLPWALAGALLSYLPYRLAGVLTQRIAAHDPPIIGTVKLIAGSVLVFLGWIAASVAVGVAAGAAWGLGLLALAPLLAYTALRWGETAREVYDAFSASWVRIFHRSLSRQLIERRHDLADEIGDAVRLTLNLRELPA